MYLCREREREKPERERERDIANERVGKRVGVRGRVSERVTTGREGEGVQVRACERGSER